MAFTRISFEWISSSFCSQRNHQPKLSKNVQLKWIQWKNKFWKRQALSKTIEKLDERTVMIQTHLKWRKTNLKLVKSIYPNSYVQINTRTNTTLSFFCFREDETLLATYYHYIKLASYYLKNSPQKKSFWPGLDNFYVNYKIHQKIPPKMYLVFSSKIKLTGKMKRKSDFSKKIIF